MVEGVRTLSICQEQLRLDTSLKARVRRLGLQYVLVPAGLDPHVCHNTKNSIDMKAVVPRLLYHKVLPWLSNLYTFQGNDTTGSSGIEKLRKRSHLSITLLCNLYKFETVALQACFKPYLTRWRHLDSIRHASSFQ